MRLKIFCTHTLTLSALMTCMTGCMVGPDFHAPKSPPVTHYTTTSLPNKTVSQKAAGESGKAQYFLTYQDIPAEWWRLLHSPAINHLLQQGLTHNRNFSAAYAALRQAQETLNAQIGNTLFPAVNAQVGGQRQLLSNASFGGGLSSTNDIFNVFNSNINVAYTLDIFGGARRQIEALRAQVDYQQFQLIATYLTLTTNIVTTAVTMAAYDAQVRTTKALLQAQEQQWHIIRQQFDLGGASQENVLTQQTLVEQTRATLSPLEKNLALTQHALAVLVGAYPNQPMPRIDLASLHLPKDLPLSLPSNLVRQRPDVRAAEALLHAASAKIGVATANLLPQLTLSGAYGWQAATPATMFSTMTNAWNYASLLSQPLFQGGALLAQRRAAIAAHEQAAAQYQQTVLQAFQNVADALRAIEMDAKTLRAQKSAEIAAESNMRLITAQYRLGGVSYIDLLTAQQQYQQTVLARVRAQAARYNDTAALFQALGGGWWHQPWCVKECLREQT